MKGFGFILTLYSALQIQYSARSSPRHDAASAAVPKDVRPC